MQDLGINVPSLIIFLVNFLILLGILYLFAFKPILRIMDQRAERISESLEAAKRASDEAAHSREDMERRMGEARVEGQRLIEAGEGDGRAIPHRGKGEGQAGGGGLYSPSQGRHPAREGRRHTGGVGPTSPTWLSPPPRRLSSDPWTGMPTAIS